MASTSARQQAWLGFLSFSALYNVPVHGAAASSSSSTQLTTFSKFPTESIGRLTASTVTTETHTVVTSASKTTNIPILPDHAHGCYFCPTDVGGLVLSGFTAPGVYPSHSPSGFPSPFPAITIDSKGDPSFAPATSSAKSSAQPSSGTAVKSTGSQISTKPTGSNTATQTASSTSVSGIKVSSSSSGAKSMDSAVVSKTNGSVSGTQTIGSATGGKTNASISGSKSSGSSSLASTTSSSHSRTASGASETSKLGSSTATTRSQSGAVSTSVSRSIVSGTGVTTTSSTGINTTLSTGSTTRTSTSETAVPATSGSTRPNTSGTTGSSTGGNTRSSTRSSTGSSTGSNTGSSIGGNTGSITRTSTGSSTGGNTGSSISGSTRSDTSGSSVSNTGNTASNTQTKTSATTPSTTNNSLGAGEVLTTLTAAVTTTFAETVTGTTVSGKSGSFSSVTTVTATYSSGQVITVGTSSKSTASKSSSSVRSSSSNLQSSGGSTGSSSTKPNDLTTDSKTTDPKTTDRKTTDSQTTTSSSALPIITVFPTESAGTVSSTVTKAGKTTETDSSDHTLILPVLPKFGSDNGLCWFCPPSGGGFVLSGFPKPGVYPTGNLPGFPTPVPQITIGPDLTPTFSQEPPKSNQPSQTDKPTSTDKTSTDKSSSTTSSECTKSVASQCQIVTSFAADPDGKTTATSIITSCVTQTGCSVQGTTSASATTTTASGCWQYAYSNDDDSISGDDDKRKRMPINALGHRTIERRAAAETASTVGTCKFNPTVTTPAYPNAANLEGAHGASYWYVPTTAALNGKKCPVVTMTQFANTNDLVAKPVVTDSSGKGVTYNIGGTTNPSVNVDHVYELSLFKGFMESVVNSGKFSCQDFESFFLAQDPNTKSPRLQVLLDQLPGNTFPDFAGMDAIINVRKGQMFNDKLSGLPNPKKIAKDFNKRLQVANEMGAAAAFVNSPDIAKLFKSTNSRIHEAFLGIDALIQNGCGKGVTPDGANGKWADAYSTYMTSLFADRNVLITRSIKALIKSDNNAPPTFTDGVDAFNAQYPSAAWAWDAGALLDWSNKSPKNIGKRDGEVCSLSSAQSTPASVSASTTKDGSSTQPTKTVSATTSKPTSTLTTTTKANSTTAGPTSTSQKPSPTSTSQKPSSTSTSTPVSTSSTPTINTDTPSCAASAGAGMEQKQAQANINSFCSILKDLGGCQTDGGDVIITNLSAACAGQTPFISNFYYDTGDTMYMNVSLAQGSSYRITQDTCNKAFGTVLNGCAPFVKGDDGFLRKYGGSIGAVENDAEAKFEIYRKSAVAIS